MNTTYSVRRLSLLLTCAVLAGCASQQRALISDEQTTTNYGGCAVTSAVDQFTDDVAMHMLAYSSGATLTAAPIVAACRDDGLVTASLTPERASYTLRTGIVAVRYRIDKGEVHDEGWNSTNSGGAITTASDAVHRLLTRLADTKDTIVFSVANSSATVDAADTDYAGAVADLRTRCAGFNTLQES